MRTKAWILSVMAMLGVFTATGCVGEDTSAFDESENDDSVGGEADGKADAVQAATYRSGCGDPIRTGKYALKGDIITPTGVVMNGYVVVQDEKIAEIRTSSQGAPAGVGVWDTKGVISPGLIDGHGHVEYNHIPIADLGKRYQNRDQREFAAGGARATRAPGTHSVIWDGKDDARRQLSAGTYKFCVEICREDGHHIAEAVTLTLGTEPLTATIKETAESAESTLTYGPQKP